MRKDDESNYMEIIEITDKIIWEKFIEDTAPQSLFQSWNWGEVQKNIKYQISIIKNKIWRLGIFDRNKLVGIAQAQKVIAKRGNFLHLRHGPIFSSWKKSYLEFLINYLKDLNQAEKTLFLRISPLIENNRENNNVLKEYGFIDSPIHSMDGEYCWVLDIDKSEEEILSNMRKTTRYLIKQAERLGVEIKKTTRIENLKEFLKLYDYTSSRHGFVKHKGINEEFIEFSKNNQILLLKGYYQNQLLAAALIVFYNHQAIYHHSASIPSKIPVNYLLQWEAIKEAKQRGKTLYNFWGIAPEEKKKHPWRGLTIFKKGFGGNTIEYLHAQDLPLSPSYYSTYIIESVRKIIKGY